MHVGQPAPRANQFSTIQAGGRLVCGTPVSPSRGRRRLLPLKRQIPRELTYWGQRRVSADKGSSEQNPERVRSYLSKQTFRRPAGAAPSCPKRSCPFRLVA